MRKATFLVRSSSSHKGYVSGVGEWTKGSPVVNRTIVTRVGNGNFGHGILKAIAGPSTIHALSATLLSVLTGGYVLD
jgi:hypothetical protein